MLFLATKLKEVFEIAGEGFGTTFFTFYWRTDGRSRCYPWEKKLTTLNGPFAQKIWG